MSPTTSFLNGRTLTRRVFQEALRNNSPRKPYRPRARSGIHCHYNIKSDADFDLTVSRWLRGPLPADGSGGNNSPHDHEMYHHMTNRIEDTYLAAYWKSYL